MYSIELTIGSVTKTVNPMSLTLPEQVCSDTLTHVELSVPVTLEYEAELLNFLISADTVNAIVKEGEEVKFTGVITTNLSFKDIGQPLPVESISLTIKDNTYKLKTKLDTELVLLNETLSEIIGSIAVGCDLSTVIPEAFDSINLPIFIIEKGQQYLNALNQLCFSYGYSFYFDAEGALCFFNFDSIPASVDELNGYHICTNEVSRQTKQYTGVKIGYNKIITKLNELVYYEGFGFDSQNKPAPAIIQPGVYFPFESSPIVEATEGQVNQSFESGFAEAIRKFNGELEYRRSKKTTLIYTQNHTLVEDWEGDLTINRTEYESKRASVRFINNSTLDVSLYQLAIRADAWYRTDECEVLAGDTGTPYEYDAQYVYDAVTAENLAKCLFKYFSLSQFTFKTKHDGKTSYTGLYKNIRLSTGAVCKSLCIAQSYDPTTDITYATWLTVSSPSVIPITASKNTSGTGTEQGAADNAQNTADTALDQINDIVEGTGENAYPDTVTGVLAVAEENGIKLTANPLGNGTKNNIKKVQWLIKRHFDADWTAAKLVETPSLDGFYYFNRAIDGYPEADQLDLWEIKAQVVNTSNKVSPSWSTIVTVTTDLYGTWSVGQPVLSGVTLKRALTVQCTQPVSSRKRYGDIKYRIEIKRHDDATYFKPNLTANPYEDEQNYKDGEGYVVVANTFTQTVPMEGQSTGEIEPTLYSFQVTPYNTTTGVVGTPAQLNLTATASSALDMYPHSIGPSILAIYDLLAVCGKFGSIQDEAIEVNSTQFWNMARLNSLLGYGLKGELCLGTTAKLTPYDPVTNPTGYKDIDSFIHWLPESIDGLDQGVYMKLKSLLITAIKARITGNFEVVQRQTEKPLFKVDDTTEFSYSRQTETSTIMVDDDAPLTDTIIDKLTRKSVVIGTKAYHLVPDEPIMLVQDLTTGIETEVATPILFKGVHNISGVLHAIGAGDSYSFVSDTWTQIPIDWITSLVVQDKTLSADYRYRECCAIKDNYLYIPIFTGTELEVVDLTTFTVQEKTLFESGRFRWCCAIKDNYLYIPTGYGNVLEVVDLTTFTVQDKTLSVSNRSRYCCAIKDNYLYIPISSGKVLEVVDLTTFTVQDKTLSADNRGRGCCAIKDNYLYIPISSGKVLEVVDLTTFTVQDKTLSADNRGRGCCAIKDNYLYIPINTGTELEVVDLTTFTVQDKTLSVSNRRRRCCAIKDNYLYIPIDDNTVLEVVDLTTFTVQDKTLSVSNRSRYCCAIKDNYLYIPIDDNTVLEVVAGLSYLQHKTTTNNATHILSASSGVIETIKASDGTYVTLPAPDVVDSHLSITIGAISFFPDFTTGKITVHNAGSLSVVNTTVRANIKTLITDGTNMFISGLGNTIYKVLQNGTQETLTLSELSTEIYYTIGIIGTHLIVIPETSNDKFAVVDLQTFTLNTYAQFSPSWGALRGAGFVYNSKFWLAEKNTRIQHCLSGATEGLFSIQKLKKIGSGFVQRTVDTNGNSELVTADGEKLTFDADKNLVAQKAEKLATSRKIGSVDFDGSKDIEVISPGTILATVSDTADTGYLLCNGAAVSRTTYASLFNKIGTKFGTGNGSTTFNLPDFREVALVGAGTNVLNASAIRAHDTYTVGQFKDDAFEDHSHSIYRDNNGTYAECKSVPFGRTGSWYAGTGFNTLSSGRGIVTRGKRTGINFQIKY